MYISTPCPDCGKHIYIDLEITERLTPASAESAILDINVVDACTASDLAHDVLRELSGYIYDGIPKTEICQILKTKFRILDRYCCDIIQQIKIELSMYCHDGVHLKYV